MAKAKKLPSGSWRVQLFIGYSDDGKRQYRSFTADTKKEAEFLAAEYNLKRKEKPKGVTVGDAIDGYIGAKENVLAPTTIAGYRNIRKTKLQGLMGLPLDKVDNITIQAEINKEAKRLSPKSVRNAHGLLSAALAMYLPDFTLHTTLPAREHKIKDLPAPGEIVRAVQGKDIELAALLALQLGLRLSEVRGIRYKDISKGGLLTVQYVRIAMDGGIEREQTKTYNSTRQLQLPPNLLQMIGQGKPDDFVVDIPARTIHKHFVKCIEDATGKHMTFHDLRHVNASIMLALGVPDKYAMERGGWSTSSTLKSIYQHTFSDERREVDRRVNDYFDRVFGGMQHDMQHGAEKST